MMYKRFTVPAGLTLISLFFGILGVHSTAQAQLSTHHYLPPVPAYANASIELQISTPSSSPVSYSIRSGNDSGGLQTGGSSIQAITGVVSAGAPEVVTFTRANNSSNASGGLGRTTAALGQADDNFGIIVEADAVVTVVMSSIHMNNRSIITAKGDNGIGRDFYAWSALNTSTEKDGSIGTNNQNSHFISILSLTDNNEITVSGDDIFESYVPSNNTPIILNALETITIGTSSNTTLTGTRITSIGDITVTSGDVHLVQPDESLSIPVFEQDGGADQLIPSHLAGTHYVVANIASHHAYGAAGIDGIEIGNRYVQIVGLSDDTTIRHYKSNGDTFVDHTDIDAGEIVAVALTGAADDGHFFSSVGSGTAPFLLYLNSSAEPGGEMGGAVLPALRGTNSDGSFCSGARFAEFAAPPDVTAYMVYVPSDQFNTLEIDTGSGFESYTTFSSETPTVIDPDAGGNFEGIGFLSFPGTLVDSGERIAFRSSARMHVAVGTAIAGQTGSFGYFSDYDYRFTIVDPLRSLPTYSYAAPQPLGDQIPRTISHCIDVDSACSQRYRISDISSDRGGTFSNVTATALIDYADPCFEFNPVAVVGVGPQDYTVTATVQDEIGDERSVAISFTFTWLDNEGDGVPDDLDLDDDNDGITDAAELGRTDLSGDTDLDGIPDYLDVDFVTCPNSDGLRCDQLSPQFDADSDGVPNHQDLDSDGDSIWDLIEGNDDNHDGTNDNITISDDNNDGVIDTIIDNNQNGLADGYEVALSGSVASIPDSDNDTQPDFLDADDDGDGLLTVFEDYNGGGPLNDNTDSDLLADYLDPDDDGDGSLTNFESPDPNGDGDPADAMDTNGSGPADYLDPNIAGPADKDGDGRHDAYDDDDDNDGILDIEEGSLDSDSDGVIDRHDLDSDNDGIPDLHEEGFGALDRNADGRIDDATDDDGDGIPNISEGLSTGLDTDQDTIFDRLDLDSDGDGITDATEAGNADADGNGRLDTTSDIDNDGLLDQVDPDNGGSLLSPPDTDGSGGADYQDSDSDGDGLDDLVEGHDHDADGEGDVSPAFNDDDGDGLDDAFDPDAGASALPPANLDGDALPDYQDNDDDGDGILSAFEDVDGSGTQQDDDTDEDGTPNYLDADDDNDGVATLSEGADPNGDGNPSDALSTIWNALPDYLNPSQSPPDTDGDGLIDAMECPEGSAAPDTDGDGMINCEDADDDGDGIATQDELAHDDSDGDGTPDYLDSDDDGDSVPTTDEIANGDTDGDEIADYLDTDDDGDGILTRFEDVNQNDDPLDDDSDADDLPNYLDNDDDGDGVGTKDEQADPNGDGDPEDALSTVSDTLPDYLNPDQTPLDTDGDGIIDNIECPQDQPRPDTDNDGAVDCEDDDDDGDGLPTEEEISYGDTDDDGTPDYLDSDDDGDGIPTEDEVNKGDTDDDGTPDYLDSDDDGDGILTEDEISKGDTDDDGTPDYLDSDDDGDGISTDDESETDDADGDGIVDYLDPQVDLIEQENIPLSGGGLSCASNRGPLPQPGSLFLLAFVVFPWLRRRRSTKF